MRLKFLVIFITLIISSLAGASESIEDILDYQIDEIQCTRAGSSCNWNSECCSGYCNSTGTCDAGGGSCVRRGYSCDWNSECCSNSCSVSGTCN